jgi:hypothetical protein
MANRRLTSPFRVAVKQYMNKYRRAIMRDIGLYGMEVAFRKHRIRYEDGERKYRKWMSDKSPDIKIHPHMYTQVPIPAPELTVGEKYPFRRGPVSYDDSPDNTAVRWLRFKEWVNSHAYGGTYLFESSAGVLESFTLLQLLDGLLTGDEESCA